jgi:hypothetical protein
MDLINYSVKDFVLNESFQKWILESDEEAKAYWEGWVNAHPNMTELIREARSTILFMKEANEKNLRRESDQVWNMITASIRDLERDPTKKIKAIESK